MKNTSTSIPATAEQSSNWLFRFIDWFIPTDGYSSTQLSARLRKGRLIVLLSLGAIFSAAVSATLTTILDQEGLNGNDFLSLAAVFIYSMNIIVIKFTGNIKLASILFCAEIILGHIAIISFSGGTSSPWLTVILIWPLITMYLFSRREGIIITASALFLLVAWFVYSDYFLRINQFTEASAPSGLMIASIITIVAIALIAASYESTNEVATHQLEAALIKQKAATEEAEAANMLKTQFLSNMSHELRTPLNAVINMTGFVVDGDMGAVNQKQVQALTQTIDSGKHLLDLINDILDLSKIEAGMMTVNIEETDLSKIFSSVLADSEGLIKEKPITLHADIPAHLPNIHADKRRVRQILLNILSNAVKYTNEGTINLKVEHVGENIVIAVTDTGIGVPQDDLEAIFESFKQAKNVSTNVPGTGLGLPITKQLVELHNGKLRFDSGLNKGTKVIIELPINNPA